MEIKATIEGEFNNLKTNRKAGIFTGVTLLFTLLLSACSAVSTGQQNAAETAAAQTLAGAQIGTAIAVDNTMHNEAIWMVPRIVREVD